LNSVSDFAEAGVGKSHLVYLSFLQPELTCSSLLFHRLREDPNLNTSFFFCNHSIRDETAENVIREWLRQVVSQLDTIPEVISAEYVQFKKNPARIMPSQQTFTHLLKSTLEQFSSPSIFLLDAFDEFRNTTDQEKQRDELCSALAEICESSSVKILITTRPQYRDELKVAFPRSQIAIVKGDLQDVENYLDDQLLPLKRVNNELKVNIKKTILDANQKEAWYDQGP
jgi:hypothetical protein